MKYKDYIWHHNPKELHVSTLKNLKETIIPFNGSVFQNFGREKRIVKGTGEFFGEDCIEQFDELFKLIVSAFKNKITDTSLVLEYRKLYLIFFNDRKFQIYLVIYINRKIFRPEIIGKKSS